MSPLGSTPPLQIIDEAAAPVFEKARGGRRVAIWIKSTLQIIDEPTALVSETLFGAAGARVRAVRRGGTAWTTSCVIRSRQTRGTQAGVHQKAVCLTKQKRVANRRSIMADPHSQRISIPHVHHDAQSVEIGWRMLQCRRRLLLSVGIVIRMHATGRLCWRCHMCLCAACAS